MTTLIDDRRVRARDASPARYFYLHMALACAATPVGPRRGPGSAGLLAFPAALVLAEGVVARWPFGGEPLGDVFCAAHATDVVR